MKFTLYSAHGSNSSQRVEWTLNYKAIAYQRLETKDGSYREINPLGYVPALRIDDTLLTESLAICEFLEAAFPEPPLLPSDQLQRAQVREGCAFVNATIHAPQNRTALKFLRPELHEVQNRELRGQWIHQNLVQLMPKLMPKLWQSSAFAIGDQFTFADIFVASMYKKARQQGAGVIAKYDQHLAHLRNFGKIAEAEAANGTTTPEGACCGAATPECWDLSPLASGDSSPRKGSASINRSSSSGAKA